LHTSSRRALHIPGCPTTPRSMPRPSPQHIFNRLRQLSLNSPPQTGLFYARLYHAICPLENNHESLHVLAICLLEAGEIYSALHAVRDVAERCGGCAVLVGRCCQKLGRFSEGQIVLQRAIARGLTICE
jgi:anaphase-promoting complex subunit 3